MDKKISNLKKSQLSGKLLSKYESDFKKVVPSVIGTKYVSEDRYSIPGSNPGVTGGSVGPTPPALRLVFDSIQNANTLVGNASSVTDWNTFFDLPNYGNPFTSVAVIGNEVQLFGGSNINVKPGLMYAFTTNYILLKIIDTNSIITVGGDSFSYCYGLTDVSLPECTIVYGSNDSPYNDNGGFGECLNLSNLYLPKLITAGNRAFTACFSLTSVNLPLLASAGESCFLQCTSLTTVNLPLVTSIDDFCFCVCTSLTTIDIPSCINLGTSVGNNQVFAGITSNNITLTVPIALMTCNSGNPDGDIEYLQANNTVTIINPSLRLLFSDINAVNAIVGNSGNVSDWNTYFDLPAYGSPFTSVQVIGNEVKLYGGSNIIIKESLFDQIDDLGTYLLEVDDAARCVIEIEYDAFGSDNYNGCKNLTSVNFPVVQTIKDYAFSICDSLISINFPIATIAGESAFGYCTSLTSVNIPNLISAGSVCFSGCSFSTITLNFLKVASYGVFASCASLTTISLPRLTVVGDYFFGDCTSLNVIYLPECLNIGRNRNNNNVFSNINGNNINLTISQFVEDDADILELINNNNVSLTTTPFTEPTPDNNPIAINLTFDSIQSANELVGNASNLSDWNAFFDLPTNGTPFSDVFVIGTTVQLVGGSNIVMKDYLFSNTNKLFYVDDSIGSVIELGKIVFSNPSLLGSLNLITASFLSVTSIDDSCFINCSSLTTISLPNCNYIGPFCFQYCINLTNVYAPLLSNLSDQTFFECSLLAVVDFPNLLTMGNNCFYRCISLISIYFPSLISAGEQSFYECENLTTVNLPLLNNLEQGFFVECSSLTSVTLPNLSTISGYSVFIYCTSLSTISLPQLTTIGDDCFKGCNNLINLSIPLCTNLGSTVANNFVFGFITGKAITLTIPSALMTCNAGNPDGDIQYLQANNTVTIVTV